MDDKVSGNIVGELFQFDRLIGKSLIKIVYFLGLGAIALWALIVLVAAMGASALGMGSGLLGIIAALIILAFGSLSWRLTCELWLVLFRIYDELKAANARD
jgi:hypothetical protein